jgi:hypothetical protein
MKLGRVRLTGDRRKGYAPIDTLKAGVDFTARDRREGQERSNVKALARCLEKNPRKPKLRRGSNICGGEISRRCNGSTVGQDPEGEPSLCATSNDRRVRMDENLLGWLSGKTPEEKSRTW